MNFTADFETTTKEEDCRVWAWGVCEIGNPDNFSYGNTIEGFFEFLKKSKNSTFYFHNLKFDSSFIFVYLFEHGFKHVEKKDEDSGTFSTLISDKGQFYSIKIIFEKKGHKTKYVQIYDSMKILPFSVEAVAKGFGLPVSKLTLDYHADRPIGHVLTAHEKEYLRGDVEIMARALDILFKQNLKKMTQGSNALYDFKRTITEKKFEKWFPVPEENVDTFIRASYRGGFTYLNPKYRGIDIGEGLVLDVNSLYPWVLRDCPLPFGEGIYYEGKYKPHRQYNLYVQCLTCQFEIKAGYLPTIQIKKSLQFIPNEYVLSSHDEMVTLYLTSVDIELFFEHYEVFNVTYHGGYMFKSATGLFSPYIDKWTAIKIESTLNGNKAMRQLAKLMLNALYGKFGLNPNVRSKIPYYDGGVIKFYDGPKEKREPLYIPVATFVTAWARHKTITSAQKMLDKWVYADTDSLHLNIELPPELSKLNDKEFENLTSDGLRKYGVQLPEGFTVDPVALGAWKLESRFTRARFVRQKCYLEDRNEPETWGTDEYSNALLNIACAGLPKKCHEQVTWANFHEGATYTGKPQPRQVKGGIILKEIEFTIR